jgi:hypothetical protein
MTRVSYANLREEEGDRRWTRGNTRVWRVPTAGEDP